MADVIGAAVIQVSADTTKLKAGVEDAKRSVKSLGTEVGNSMADGAVKASRSLDAYIKKLELTASTVGKSAREVRLLELTQRGATEAQLKAADAALKTIEASKLQQSEARKAADAARTAAAIQQASEAAQAKATEDAARRYAAAEAAKRTALAATHEEALRMNAVFDKRRLEQTATSQAEEARRGATDAALAARVARDAQAKAGRLSAQQNIQLGYQLNDFFVQVASGQSPLTAAIQQGSQLTGVYGGMGNALRAVGSIFTITRVLIGGAATALGGFVMLAREGNNESTQLAKSLTLTGNAAGMTEGRFNAAAKAIADGTRTTIGSSRETLQALVSSGRLSGDALNETAKATQLMSKVTGESTEDVRKQFGSMTDGVAKWAETANRSYNFLTAEQLKHIKTLEEQGDAQKAIQETMRALNGRLTQAAHHTDALSKGWSNVKDAISSAKEAMLSFFRETPVEDRLSNLRQQLADREASGSPRRGTVRGRDAFGAGNQALRDQIAALEEVQRLQTRSAEQSARSAQTEQAKIAFDKLREQSLTKQQKLTKELANANALADKAGLSQADRAAVLAGIRDKHKETDLSKPTLELDIAKIEAQLGILTNSYKNAESILEATRSSGLISEKEYYDAKRSFIDLNAQAQVRALEKENALLMFQKVGEKQALENQKKIAENQGKINEIKAEAAAKGVVLDTQQKTAVNQVTRAYEEARIAAQDYLNTLTRQQGRELNAFGRGDKERGRLSARQQIEDRYEQQRLDLESNKRLLELEGKFTPDARKRYEERLGIVNEFQGQALDGWDKHYAAIGESELDWLNGATRAAENYVDNTRNVAKQTEGLFSTTFQGLEDTFARAAATGKLSMKDMVNSINAELARIATRKVTGSIADALAKAFGGGGYQGGAGADGLGSVADFMQMDAVVNAKGNVFADGQIKKFASGAAFTNSIVNQPTRFNIGEMGEAGPEAIMPLRRGPDGSLGVQAAGGGKAPVVLRPTYHIQIDGTTDMLRNQELMRNAVEAGNAKLIEDMQNARMI